MSQYPILNNYVSEIDQFLQQFDKKHPNLSKSQLKEQIKYQRIYQLRDSTVRLEEKSQLWKDF